ncbi:hypothetical protein Aperf_G00000075381 [Anoplocephala perfoliata]
MYICLEETPNQSAKQRRESAFSGPQQHSRGGLELSACPPECRCFAKTVRCSGQGLTDIPKNLPLNTERLIISSTSITRLKKESFWHLPVVTQIVLIQNNITAIEDGVFEGVKNLQNLDLRQNRLRCIYDGTFQNARNLRVLKLDQNKISWISSGAFNSLVSLQWLSLNGNPIQCDCHLAAVMRNFKKTNRQSVFTASGAICDSSSRQFPGADAAEVLELIFCPSSTVQPIPQACQVHQISQPSSCQSVCSCATSGYVSCVGKNLKTIPQDLPDNIITLYLENNQLNCDCSIHWLPEFLKRNEAGGGHWSTCHMPVNFKGRYVRDLALAPCKPGEIKLQCKLEPDWQHQSRPQQDLDVAQDCPKACICTQLSNRVQRSTDDVITFTSLRPGVVEVLEPSLKVTCTNSGLTSIPIGIPENTRELYLDYNSIHEVNKDDLEHLKKLEVLSLHHNQISCIRNATFTDLTKLKVLQLHSNKIQCIGSSAFHLKSLKLVSLDDNPLNCGPSMAWISRWIQQNPTLIMPAPTVPTCISPIHLKLSPITSLSALDFSCVNGNSTDASCEINCCSNDEPMVSNHCPDVCVCNNQRVDCSGKALTEIPKALPSDTRDLFLEHNAIASIDSERIAHLKNLETLLLSNNKIVELNAGTFENLSNLRSLVLSSNELRCIHPSAFNGLKQLKALILQNNDISTLENGTFQDLEQMNNLALGQNPLHCDCNLRWLHVFFRAKYLDNGVAICASPRQMKFKSVFHSNLKNFTCFDDSEGVRAKCNPCSSNPCLNGGKCKPVTGVEFKCSCSTPFYGERCEKRMDACFGQPCKNGGICKMTDNLGHYRCVCSTGFKGSNCEENIDDCKNVVCKNGGVCVDGVNNYTCKCAPGFKGKLCENAFQYCIDENPCQNDGVCVMQNPSGFKCICPEGWGGIDCSENLDDCEYSKCENGGVCKDRVSGYVCECPHGFSGEYCENLMPSRMTAVKNSPSFGCAYNRCMDGSVCQPDMSSKGYRCNCPNGRGGTFCEKVYSFSTSSTDVHIPVKPPSRGCFLPRGNLSLTFSTNQQQGILLFFSEAMETNLSSHRFLVAELYHGHVKISFAIGAREVALAYSMSKLADGTLHRLDIIVILDRVEMYVDGTKNALIQSVIPKADHSDSKPRALVSAAPIYLAGAPKRLVKASSRSGIIGSIDGIIACVGPFYINDKPIDFSATLGNSSSLKSGCGSSSSSTSLKSEFASEMPHPRRKTEMTQPQDRAIAGITVNIGDCRKPDSGCLNGGVCIPEYALPGNAQNRRWDSSPSRHVCKCPIGFEGVRCESTTFCKRHSRYSHIFDPDTGCISTRRIVIRSCSGSCQEGVSTSLMWDYEERQRKRRMRKRARRRVRRHRIQWSSYSSSPLPGVNRVTRSIPEISGTCCQPIRFKQKSIQFHCPKNGDGVGRVYSRWFRFVRKCGCTTSCHSDDSGAGVEGTPSAAF